MTEMHADPRRWLPADAAHAAMNSHYVVEVTGADAASLLQGQLSNDIDALETSPGQLSSYNSPKGRVLALLRVLKHGDRYWLAVDSNIADGFVQRLRMFVLRSKVSINADPGIVGMVLAGPGAMSALAKAGLPAPGAGSAEIWNGRVFLGMPGPVPRVEIYAPMEKLPGLAFTEASDEDLARWDILAGLPRMLPDNQDAHVAQHLNLDELGAVNFRKGCYTGQEIIARMKYLGKVKKRAATFVGSDLAVGAPVRDADDRAVGEIVNVAPAGDRQLALAVVSLDAAESLLVNGNPLVAIRP